jgi:acid stress-induced BolA-like protein IbaG/YrbA
MNALDVKKLIEDGIADSECRVEANGSNVQLIVISDAFDGVSPIKKQQMVYACLQEKIADGTIHAVTMKTWTQAEWQKQKVFHGG